MAGTRGSNATVEPWAGSSRPLARLVFPTRHLGILGAAAGLLLLPSLGDGRFVIALVCVVVLLPIDVAMHASTRATGRFPWYMPYLNQFLAGGVVAAMPELVAPAVAVLVADDALTAFVFGRRTAVAAGALGVVLLGGVTLSRDVDGAWPAIVGLALSAATCAVVLGALADRERSLRSRYRSLVSEVDVVVWEGAPGSAVGEFSYVSHGAVAVLGHPVAAWFEPGFWLDHVHAEDAGRVLAERRAAVAAGIDHVLHYRMEHADGHWVHLRDVVAVELDPAGRVANTRGVLVDISDRRRAEEALHLQATHDVLTGLPNRALLLDRIDQALREGDRTGECVALLLLDLDEFKEVNDTLGHDAGDRLLVAFADRLRHELRDCDTLARLGGDEFAVLLTTGATTDGAGLVANRIVASMATPFLVDGIELRTGASIGIGLYPEHARDGRDLLARADAAMYQAKRSGQSVALFEPGAGANRRRTSVLSELRHALDDDQLVLEYQPCFDLGTGRVAAIEALVRWDHPEHGRIGPDDFIRLAEMSGLMAPLTRFVLERAVRATRDAAVGLRLAVNLSVRNLTEPDLVPWLASLVERYDLGLGQLTLELTESAVMSDVDAAVATLEQVRLLGVHLALDDFGTGQSTLAYLRRLPVHELKIDKLFVAGVGHDPGAFAICTAVVELAHRLGLRVVAEGASDPADVRALRQLGCDLAQGFFLGPPVPESELAGLRGRTMDLAARDFGPAMTPQ